MQRKILGILLDNNNKTMNVTLTWGLKPSHSDTSPTLLQKQVILHSGATKLGVVADQIRTSSRCYNFLTDKV